MEHLAILSKKRKLLEKIISGSKTIESRWYKTKKAPFGTIFQGDSIYFKESGDRVSVKATADKILTFDDLNEDKIKQIISDYGNRIGINLDYLNDVKDKKMCMLIGLKEVKKIKPFDIDKKGFGNMSAWISIDNIERIKKRNSSDYTSLKSPK